MGFSNPMKGRGSKKARPKRGGLSFDTQRPQSQILYMVFFNAIANVSMDIGVAAEMQKYDE
jgi:hypothetical protein